MSAPEIKLDDDDDFDVSFFEEIERLEKSATHNRRHHQPPPLQPQPHQPYFSPAPPLPPQPPPFHHFPASTAAAAVDDINYSPPRELSQRFTAAAAAASNNSSNSVSVGTSISSTSTRSSRSPVTPPNSEINILKGDLIRVTKELSDVKEENSLLKKERDKKKQHIVVHPNSKTVSCDAEASLVHPRNGASVRRENSKPVAQSGPTRAKTEQKSVGIQTDTCNEPASPSISGTASSFSGRPKLLEIWSSSSSHCSQRKFVTKMLETSATDFCYLFGFMGLNVTSTTIQDCLTHIPLTKTIRDSNSDEVRRVSQLYSVLKKLSNNTVHISAFMDILLDLCKVDNALVVHWSSRILRVAVRYLLSSQRIRPRSVLCSGIMFTWRNVPLLQIMSTCLVLIWGEMTSCVIPIEIRRPVLTLYQLSKS